MGGAVTCDRCGGPCEPRGGASGYGVDAEGRTYCYPCCAKRERERMTSDGRATLYLSRTADNVWTVTDWPGELRFAVRAVRRGRHNLAGTRTDAWFAGPDGHLWHAVQYGDDNQIARCRRTRVLA